MSEVSLRHIGNERGVSFYVEDSSGSPLHIDQWGLQTINTEHGAGSVGHLLSLYEDEVAEFKNNKLLVAHADIAELDAVGLMRLGLPEPAPFRLEIRGDGLISSPRFEFAPILLNTKGHSVPLMIEGCFIKNKGKRYTLLNPIFALLEGVGRFNALAPDQIDDRFELWSELQEILPEDSVVEDHFKTMSIVRADSFSLDYTAEQDINPVLLSHKKVKDVDALTDDPNLGEPLPSAKQADFEEKFRSYSDANQRYAVAGGWYVILGENVRKALSVVRQYQDKSPQERRALLDNPRSILKEYLGDLTEDEIEAVFEETEDYKSKRVAGLGEWHPKLCAYVLEGENEWIPPEDRELSIPLQDGVVQVEVKEVPEIIKEMESAQASGESEINFNGQTVSVTEENIEKLKSLGKPKNKGSKEEDNVKPEPVVEQKLESLVPIIIDNIEEVGYVPVAKKISGAFGGIPELINKDLYDHQIDGLRWLQKHWMAGNRGALLADDMGLGKTIQTLAFLAWVQEQYSADVVKQKPFLVVAPTGLLRNWEEEAGKHLNEGGLGFLTKMFGSGTKTVSKMSHREQLKELSESSWVLTTYETMRDKINMFTGVEWGVVVFDEVQKIKNPTSRVTEMAKALDTDFVLALTGTPVENRLSDLWSILDTTSPGYLGSLQEFHRTYERDAEAAQEAITELSERLLGGDSPIILRRMKKDQLSSIPIKHEHIREGLMSESQRVAYKAAIDSVSSVDGDRSGMLQALQSMRKVSLLATPVGADGLTDESVQDSARLAITIQILDEVASKGEKALLFVESREVQELLIPYLQKRYNLSIPPRRINGSITGAKRQKLVNEFQDGLGNGEFDVMILSPKAAGVGLTITAANHVIHLTRWWNPAVEDQCTDRAYRIGQEKDVHVYLPIALFPDNPEYSFDKNLHELLERKRGLSRSVLAPVVASDSDLNGLYESTFG